MYLLVISLLAAFVIANDQTLPTVPAILYSHNLAPGVFVYQEESDPKAILSESELHDIAIRLVSKCNSDAYIFVNQPGLTAMDFIEHKDAWNNLRGYLKRSSTALKFEHVAPLSQDFYQRLIAQVKSICDVKIQITINDEELNSFSPYLDTEKRIIVLDLPELTPSFDDVDARFDELELNDRMLRTILGRLPSPSQTVIYTALGPQNRIGKDIGDQEIFPDVFHGSYSDPELDLERRNTDRYFPEHRPKFDPIDDSYLSIFDQKFREQNSTLISLIVLAVSFFITWQLFNQFLAPTAVKSQDDKGKSSTEEDTTKKPKVQVKDTKED
ncbi:HBR264Cp [Eremothecium sinecaudum]|uniref:Protein BIG1 n=1 Tax=Eremothecium sinecaudum TaxID=45286 RepID=A0A125RE18_9SACH|nr:HBR264Cp [Eremothecium sinecaudum]AMD19165.1 HBR264Cp [Eremothecium sinecaudum]